MNGTNIGLLHYAVPPVVGGVESVLAQHARLMVAAGHQVRAIAGRGAVWEPAAELVLIPEVDSRHPRVLEVKSELDRGRLPPDFPLLTEHILAGLRQAAQGLSVLIAHNVCSLHKNLALTAAVRQLSRETPQLRVILWHHDLAWTTPRYQSELHSGFPWDLLRTHWGARQVAVSEPRRLELSALLGLSPDEITVVPNGIPLSDFHKLEDRTRQIVRDLRLYEADPLLLTPVRITPRKNLELGLHILAALRRRLSAAGLVITGPPGAHNPANREYLSRLLALRSQLGLDGAVQFLAERGEPDLPDAVIADFYRLADALLLPSREEGFGIPLLEAALSRMPVFCSDIPALRHLGGERVNYFATEADPEAVAEVIAVQLAQDRAYQAARRTRREFAWPAVYVRHIAPLLKP